MKHGKERRKRAYIQPRIEYNDEHENMLSRSYCHMFGNYVNAIFRAGLKIQEVREPVPPEEWKTENFGRYDHYIEMPAYLIFRLSR